MLASAAKMLPLASMKQTSRATEQDKYFLKVHGKAVGISKAPVSELSKTAEGLELANPTSHLLTAIKAEVERRQSL
jgi:hypothetical protein